MASSLQNPTINWDSRNLQEEWRKFRQHADLMFAGPLNKNSEAEKCAYLLIWSGEKGREIYNTWDLTVEDSKKLEVLRINFERYTTPKKNTLFARYVFQSRKQQEGEQFETFVTDIRTLVKDCLYKEPEEMVRDRIVCGIISQDAREKLLQMGEQLTMQRAIEIVVTHDATKQQLAAMQKEETVEVINKRRTESSETNRRFQHFNSTTKPQEERSQKSDTHDCGNCGQRHGKKACPAYGKQCRYCAKMNHFSIVCRSRRYTRSKAVHQIEEADELNSSFIIDMIADGKDHPDTVYANINIETGDVLRFKIDTGAQANVIPYHIYMKMTSPPQLKPGKSSLYGYAGQRINVKGTMNLTCSYKTLHYQGTFYVADTQSHSQPVLGLQASLQLQIIKMVLTVGQSSMNNETVLQEYSHLFQHDLGNLEGEVDIYLQENSVPVVHAPRRVPHALRDRLKAELDAMQETGVIAKVTRPTDWVNSLVVVEKPNGKLRICLDPKDLNRAIKRPHYAMPTLEDALAKISGAKYFSKLDAKSGYWQMKLSTKASFMTTFNTPFGRYRFLRMPFGLVSAQDEFQRKMDEVFEGVPGIVALIDDLLISGATREEHDHNLRAALDKATEKQLQLNPEKLTVGVQEIEYFGLLITSEGIKPDPMKVKAVQEMKPPADRKELETMLGMVTYLSKFAPNLAETTKPLRDLLKKDNEFLWDAQQQSAWDSIKSTLASQPVLAIYDPNKQITLQVDASKHGLGAVLFQDNKPIAYASKSLSKTEENYAQIEKELYAIVFGCERFHQYIYGQHQVLVQSDHKPLETILKKPLASAPPRLQRMLLRLQKYSIRVVHVPGKQIPVADTLSRKSLPPEPRDVTEDLDAQIHSIIHNLPVSDQKMELIRKTTADDQHLCAVVTYICNGWPESRQHCLKQAEEFWSFRDEISLIDGVVFKGERIVIPAALRPEMLSKIHSSHLGVEKCLQRARQLLFWPNMAADIERAVTACTVCSERRPSNPKEPMLPHDIPSRPWQKVATDLFTWENKDYLITTDYYSRFFELDEMTTTTTAAVVRKLKAHFARHGIPETLISDNGPQYASAEFALFAKEWDFDHIKVSPRYAQSNGLAEKTVQIAKSILDKAKAGKGSALISLLEYRNTPVDGLESPAHLLMSRQLRSVLPVTQRQLQPQVVDPQTVVVRRLQCQATQKRYYDRGSRPLPTLQPGDEVFVQLTPGGRWQPARITARGRAPRSYVLQTTEGSTYRRNRRFIRCQPRQTQGPPPEPTLVGNVAPEPATAPLPNLSITRSGRVVTRPRRLIQEI